MKNTTKKWKIHEPSFEFIVDLPLESSAWIGHYYFAYDLVSNTKPKIIVELGTHKGNSLFSFAQAIKDFNLDTELHGVDTWVGDEQAGFYGEEVYNKFLEIKDKYYKDVNIIPHKMFFDEAVEKFEDNSIDILHIDGLHTYDAVKHDFETWLPKVKKNTGIILFHDVCEKSDDFGVYKLWDELKEEYKTMTFKHYHGLGVLTLDNFLISKLPLSIDTLVNYYNKHSKVEDLKKELKDKEAHIEELEKKMLEQLKIAKQLNDKNQELKAQNQELKVYNTHLQDTLSNTIKEIEKINNSKSWKLTKPLRKISKSLRNLINKNDEI
jgi:hypothetical protein